MAKDYGFSENIESLRKQYGIRGDRLQIFLEKSGAQSEEEAIEAINGKYGTVEETNEDAEKLLEGDADSGDDAESTENTESDDIPENDEVSASEDIVESVTADESVADEVSERASAETGSAACVSEKLYVHHTRVSSDPIVHPVSGKKL